MGLADETDPCGRMTVKEKAFVANIKLEPEGDVTFTNFEIKQKIEALFNEARAEFEEMAGKFEQMQMDKFKKIIVYKNELITHPEYLMLMKKLMPFVDNEVDELLWKLRDVSDKVGLYQPFAQAALSDESTFKY
ncbi:hypothetical protein ACFLZH_05250 [Patescibacteria group bacterium]